MKEENTNKTHFYWLDLLRFFVALMVVVTHVRGNLFVNYGELTNSNGTVIIAAFFAITRFGHEAVITFFVLSGFLVGGMVLERLEKGVFDYKSFAIDRVVRIMLPLVPALVFTAIVCWIIERDVSLIEFIGNLFSLQGVFVSPFGKNGPLWSLSYEVWFYVFALLIGIFFDNKSFSVSTLFFLIIPIAIFTILSPVYLFIWIIGALAYFRRPKSFSFIIFISSIFLIFYSLLASQIGSQTDSVNIETLKSYFPTLDISMLLLSLGVILFIQQIILLKPRKVYVSYLESFGSRMAAFSYTLYLTHYPLIELVQYFGVPKYDYVNIESLLNFILVILVSCIFAWILYLGFEKHTSLLKKVIKKRILIFNELRKK